VAAFLSVDVLRAYATPSLPCAIFAQAAEPASSRLTSHRRPTLVARWAVTPDGRLSCRWETDASTISRPPPE
jgi:hypothetical protein